LGVIEDVGGETQVRTRADVEEASKAVEEDFLGN
jgi:hypothetical protein